MSNIYKKISKGAGSITEAIEVPVSQAYKIEHVTLHLSVAPTTSENFTITMDAKDGAQYDTLLQSVDLSASATTDLVWYPDEQLYLTGGDSLDVAFANTDGVTFGLQVAWSLV
jgi:hypothetical protein